MFDKDIFCFRIAPLELQKIELLFRKRKRFQKGFQEFTSKGDFLIAYEPDVLFVLFQQKLYKKDRGEHLLRHILIWCIIIKYE